MAPPARLCVPMLYRGLRACVRFALSEAEKSKTRAREGQNHPKMASGGLLGTSWAAPGAQEAFLQIPLLHFEPFWPSPGGVREASGGPLGRLWALLARLWALPGVFFGVSGALSEAAEHRA